MLQNCSMKNQSVIKDFNNLTPTQYRYFGNLGTFMKTILECRDIFSKYDKIGTVSDLQAIFDSKTTPKVLFVRYRENNCLSPEEWVESQPDTIESHGHTYKKTDGLLERTWSNRKVVDASVLYTREIVETFIEFAVKYIIID